MTPILTPRARPLRTYGALALFVVVYLGVLALVFAPKELMPVETGAVFSGGE